MSHREELPQFLADTWWYGLTDRITLEQFSKLAYLRREQGFTAIQLVMGIPPETNPNDVNSFGNGVPAWNEDGDIQVEYVDQAQERLELLDKLGFTAIIYGAWGDHIDWIGTKKMTNWWKKVINVADGYDPVYCLTGEIDLKPNTHGWYMDFARKLAQKSPLLNKIKARLFDQNTQYNADRKEKWDTVFNEVEGLTKRPIIIHTTPSINSNDGLKAADQLSAVTVQTGHSKDSRRSLWRLPLENFKANHERRFINLEPWYEGINDNFYEHDQLYAFWTSMLAGSYAYCYGAHGVWNVGDGKFRNHWGTQTLNEAMQFETPKKLGDSYKLFLKAKEHMSTTEIKHEEDGDGNLIWISQQDKKNHSITFYTDMTNMEPLGILYSPKEAKFITNIEPHSQLIEFVGFSQHDLFYNQ